MIRRRLVTRWVETTLAAASGMPVGPGRRPPDRKPPPYYLLYSVDTALSGAPLADTHEDASFVYQITCVSGPDPAIPDSTGTLAQAEWLADTARAALLGRDPATGRWLHPFTVPGVSCIARSLETEPGGTNDPGDAIIGYVLRIRLDLTTT